MSNFLYLIRCGIHYKIGVARDVSDRLAQLQTGNPVLLELIASFEFDSAEIAERAMHQKFSHLRGTGEWFALSSLDVAQFNQVSFLLGGRDGDVIPNLALDEEVQFSDDVAGGGEPNQSYDDMISDGWRVEIQKRNKNGKESTYWNWRRGSVNREYIYGGVISTLPPACKNDYTANNGEL